VSIDHGALTDRLITFVDTEGGRSTLAALLAVVLAHEGAPTWPGGPTAPLLERRARGEPLTEDTDARAPLGPFRDWSIVPGTLGELCGARLRTGAFAGDVLLDLLVPVARAEAADLLADALDDADARTAAHAAWARVLGGPLRTVALDALLGVHRVDDAAR
jgi:hypothetical protein